MSTINVLLDMNELKIKLQTLDTYERIGAVVPVSKQAVGNWVANNSLPSHAAIKIAEHYNISLDWLFGVKFKNTDAKIQENAKDHMQQTQRHLDVERLIVLLTNGDIKDNSFRSIVKAFKSIVDLVEDIEQCSIDDQDKRNGR